MPAPLRPIDLSRAAGLSAQSVRKYEQLGFLPPIRRIVATLPKKRQNLFFSATMPTEIGKLMAVCEEGRPGTFRVVATA